MRPLPALSLALLFCSSLLSVARSQPSEAGAEIYKLNIGDEIAITVIGEPDLDERLRIDGQGMINQKFLGLVSVVDRTITDAERFLEQELINQKYLRKPVVRIKLTAYAQRGVVVFGAVDQPGVVSFPPETSSMDILDVIAKCGGFTANARRNSVRVKRRSTEGDDQMLTVNVRNLLSGRESTPFVVLPGDVITVDG